MQNSVMQNSSDMRKIFVSIAVLALAFACKPVQENPLETALRAKITESVGEGAKIDLRLFEITDSTSVGKELEYRKGLFDVRLSQNIKLFEKYSRNNQTRSAAEKLQAIESDKRIIEGLRLLEDDISDCLEDIAYYYVHFSGSATLDGAVTEFKDYYAAISPSGEVLSVSPQMKGLHTSLGRTIPGYRELLKGSDSEPE